MSYRKQMKRVLLATVATATFAVAIPAISSTTAYAQDYTTGILRGTVQDTTGAVVAGATVAISSTKGVNRTAVTGADGTIRMPRLPVGNYMVNISHDGHETLADQNIYISVGEGSGVTFTMSIPGSEIDEIVVSGTAVGNWDFNSTTTGLSVNVGDLFDKTPIARTATSVALLAPGTGLGDTAFATDEYGSQGNNATFSGSSVGENAYYINGLNVTNFRNMVGGSTVPFEFYELMEVKTGGYQAEFGRSTGGVINAVTKSGSNELHFGANVFWEPNSMYEKSPDTFAAQNHLDQRSQTEYNFWASGAIVEDKLFFYGLYNPRNISQLNCGNTRCEEVTRNDPFYGVKLDFVPFDGHRFEYTYFSDNQDADTRVSRVNNETDSVGDIVGDSTFKNGGSNSIYHYTGTFTDWFTLSAMYGENSYDRTYDNDTDIPSILEFRNGAPGDQTGFDPSIANLTSGADTRKAYRIDADFYFNLAGEHHIRVGWDQEKLRSLEDQRYNGNAALRYYDNDGSSTGERFRVRQYWNQGDFSTTQSAAYIQDSWQITNNLTINLGLRNETFDNRNADGDTFVKISNQLAPRFGFSWDPTGDGSNRVYGSWGRYYLPIATNTNIRMAGRELYVQQFFELPTGWNPDIPYITGPHITPAQLTDHRLNGTPLPWVTAGMLACAMFTALLV